MNLPAMEERIAALLKNVGDPGRCKGCQADIFWVTHKNGKRTPYVASGEALGVNHHVDCPAAMLFDKRC